ncbi:MULTISPECIES: hypothetical protein [Halomonadaceae]|jgi:hypothetical protein|uniref:Uncharacterized protein n=1 Tax=Vreelandella piezotolerans TaxID=2609667 RepID=A0ABQ6X9L5_9GAMM|nr:MULTISPECIES: hypothetical protein [Halomonas]KAE8438694.1 hypothetical protein F1978_07000 [Halomonas piezotolerans]MCG7590460.1 hypothetical protein [Halomonas sp. McD50-5]MCG7616572.1 hypothetical protein [Halomonas sp. McD50-4]QJA25511.1 hypothetical protein GYM47_16160 [Halomonas piezotolerans]|tara:strand:- start:58 stop:270 length:213 start_codon:yes stop_codon:yes gene_type:complete
MGIVQATRVMSNACLPSLNKTMLSSLNHTQYYVLFEFPSPTFISASPANIVALKATNTSLLALVPARQVA